MHRRLPSFPLIYFRCRFFSRRSWHHHASFCANVEAPIGSPFHAALRSRRLPAEGSCLRIILQKRIVTDPVLVLPDAGQRDGSSYTVTPVGERSVDDAATAGLCGCKLCAPVVSADACSTDADCAPSTPCHARECVARSKATPRTSGLNCTMNLVCEIGRCQPMWVREQTLHIVSAIVFVSSTIFCLSVRLGVSARFMRVTPVFTAPPQEIASCFVQPNASPVFTCFNRHCPPRLLDACGKARSRRFGVQPHNRIPIDHARLARRESTSDSPVAGRIARGAPSTERKVLQQSPVMPEPQSNSEKYTDYGVNPFVQASADKLSTFAIDVDTASYSIARRKSTDAGFPQRRVYAPRSSSTASTTATHPLRKRLLVSSSQRPLRPMRVATHSSASACRPSDCPSRSESPFTWSISSTQADR